MITRLGIARKQFYRLEVFTRWARDQTNSSAIRSQVGSFRSAHVFRERGPLHHEYVIVSFGRNDGSVSQSWLRAERAPANTKKDWYTPNQESSGPLLGGATLRESISFASSTDDLRLDEDDELASVTVDNRNVTPSSHTMLLNGLADQFAALANTSRRYHLLSENCRWYARHNILGIAEHLTATGVLHRTCWLGQPCIVEVLRRKLGDEPFGGRQAEGPEGVLVRIRSSLDHSWSLIVHGNPSEALPLCTEALTMLGGGKPDSHYPPFSISLAWSVYGCALHDLDRLGEALDAHQKACDISRSIREQESHLFLLSHGALATTLHKMGRQSEAANVWRELVDARRRIHRAYDNLESTNGVAQALTNYALVLTELPKRREHCIRALKEAIVLWRRLASQRSDLYRSDLQGALTLYAKELDLAGRPAEAGAIKREISSLQPVSIRRAMAKNLYGRAKSEAAHGNLENAFVACKESVEQFRLLFDESPNDYRTHITKALDCLFDYQGLVKPSSNTVEACEEAISFYRLQSVNSQEYFGRLAEWFIDYSSVLDALGRTTEAFESSLEGIAVSRKEFAVRPRVFRRNIASCLFNHAIYAAKLERWSDAIEADQESVKHRRHLYKRDASGYRDRLALGLANLGLHYHGAGKHLEALRTWDEALDLYRILSHSDQERYRAPLKALLNRAADLIDARGITPAIVPTLKISNPDSLRQEAEAVERGAQGKRWGIGKLVRKKHNSVM
jgi:tetratricopeptide (TPR) repeat protein